MSLSTLLLVIAFILFVLATFGAQIRVNLTAAGLAFLVASLLAPAIG